MSDIYINARSGNCPCDTNEGTKFPGMRLMDANEFDTAAFGGMTRKQMVTLILQLQNEIATLREQNASLRSENAQKH